MDTFLASTPTSAQFARRLAHHLDLQVQEIEFQQFPDGEEYLRYASDDRFHLLNRHVILVGATECSRSLEQIYRLGCAAAKHGARSLILVIPYLGYSTMERAARPGEVVAMKTVARQLSDIPRAALGNRVLLVDLHSPGIAHYFEGDIVALELTAEERFATAIRDLNLPDLCVASADMGRAKRVESLANRLGAPVALIHKKRTSGSHTRVLGVVGDVEGRHVVIYDDMIRTGGSLAEAADTYMAAGAASVHAAATHLVLPPGAIERLEESPLARVIGTDSHPNHGLVADRPRFQVLPVADLFAAVVRRLLV